MGSILSTFTLFRYQEYPTQICDIIMFREFLSLACFAIIFCEAAQELSAGAKRCFEGTKSNGKKRMEGTIRRVKLSFCEQSERIKASQGFAFDDLEIRVGNVLFNTNPRIQRTVLMKNTQVQICMYGKLDTNRLRSSPAKLQISAHGKPESFPEVAGVKINLPDLGIDADFCDLDPNGCHTTVPGCDEVVADQGVQEFCSCSTLTVPDYAPAGTDVEVTWKVLEVPDETDVDVCEKKFKIEDLWNEESKETLACLKIPATVKACGDLSTTARAKIQGC